MNHLLEISTEYKSLSLLDVPRSTRFSGSGATEFPSQRTPQMDIVLSERATTPFPLSRLANTTVGNSSNIYLDHRINDIVIAEDMYHTNTGFFTSTSFEI